MAIRVGPGTTEPIIGLVYEGSEVEACEQQGNWLKLAAEEWPRGTDPRRGAWMMLDGAEAGLSGALLRRLPPRSRWDWRVQRGEDGRFTLLPPKLPSHPVAVVGADRKHTRAGRTCYSSQNHVV
eukprot:COSAG02_NODE_1065_length_14831_cov_34.330981_4_plen_124_part_00